MAKRTALDVITQSLKRLGVLSGIETPSADLAEDGLVRLNDLIETWSTESLTLWTQIIIGGGSNNPISDSPLPPIVPPIYWYSIGPTGSAIEMPDGAVRPAWVDAVSVILPGSNPKQELRLQLLSPQDVERLSIKFQFSTLPTHYYYRTDWSDVRNETSGAGMVGRLYLWPMPSVTLQVWVYIPIPLIGPVALTTVIDLPPGYGRALRDWLAIELAPEMGREVPGTLLQSAIDAKAQLQRVNFRPKELEMPAGIGPQGGSAYDWRTGE